jgi:ubiquinone/menaquinone biosynthesis C-methylase UbiE
MTSIESKWGSSYRLIAAEKWRAKSAAMGRNVTRALVEHARPASGMKVLDLASGTGEPAISLASRVGPEGEVTALDLSKDLLAIAEQRAQQRRLTNFRTCEADAHDLPFPDNAFDLVTCRFGIMFFADCEKALREVRRVLKPGGRACFVAWGPFEQPYWASTMGIVQKHVGGSLLEPGTANMFRFADPGSLAKLLHHAGFVSVEEEVTQVGWTWPGSAEEVWEYAQAVSAPFRPLLERIPEDKREQIEDEVLAAVRQYEDSGRIKFGVTVVFASGSKPSCFRRVPSSPEISVLP